MTDLRCSPSIFPVAMSKRSRRPASRPTRRGPRCCPESVPVAISGCIAVGKPCLACCFIEHFFALRGKKQRLGNDVPSERLHLGRVELPSEKDERALYAACNPAPSRRSEGFADDSLGAVRFLVRSSRFAACGS